jgi:signal transduction histidine kinase
LALSTIGEIHTQRCGISRIALARRSGTFASMPLPLRDVAALLVAVVAAIASLVAWSTGTVSLGLQLAVVDGQVHISDVTPDGNAAASGVWPGVRVLDVSTVDGSAVRRGEPLQTEVDTIGYPPGMEFHWGEQVYESIDGHVSLIGPNLRPPIEAVDPASIESLLAGDVSAEVPEPLIYASLDRTLFELELRSSVWVLGFGIALGVALWALLRHGAAGRIGRQHAIAVGCAAAAPFLVLPLLEVGTPVGISAAFVVPGALALIVGLSLAREHPDRSWAHTASVGAAVAAGLAVLLLVRYLTSPTLGPPHDRGGVVLMVAAIAFIPALVASTVAGQTVRHRLGLLSLALVPGAALTLIGPPTNVAMPTLLVGVLVGWQLLPVERAFPDIERRLSGIGGSVQSGTMPSLGPISATTRDVLALGSFVLIVLGAMLGADNTWSVIGGLGLAALVWFSTRQGFLGPAWTDSAVPLAVAVGTPVVLSAFGSLSDNGSDPWVLTAIALAGLPVAHVLAARYPDATVARRLWWASITLVPLGWLVAASMAPDPALIVVGAVSLVPGIPLAFARSADDARGVSARLETMAVAVTPAVAATTLYQVGIVLFGAWLAALVIWKYATIAPLLRFAQRTQLQRDLAVAAAETERARLAADLHDDALQQLTMLVRKLDERGDASAAEAREVADKLRAVVGDLRLPILDDLGAGAALEWLVERVEPLAGGPVKLERSDEARPPATVELAVFRVAQEAITNAIKHGRPPIQIRYDVRSDGRVTLAVDDAGEGIGPDASEEAPRQGHFGLANMQQRAEQIGALLDVRRWPSGGTRVALEWRPE